MVVDCFATERHYFEHLAPVWEALHPSERGTFYVNGRTLSHLGDGYTHGDPPAGDTPTLTAAYGAYQRARRPVIYCEHGVGQQYPNANRGYAGAAERERVVLFLNPNDHTTDVNAAAHPDIPSVTVGVPYLDRFRHRVRTGKTVAFSFHWQNGYFPAATSAFNHYRRGLPDAIAELRANGWRVIGTAHPRAWSKNPAVGKWYDKWGVESVHDLAEVIERADVLCADNTSAQLLTAALGVRQVVLDHPPYQQGYDLGLWPRFSVPFGFRVSEAAQIPYAVEHVPTFDVSSVVPFVDGRCAERAVDAIRRHVL